MHQPLLTNRVGRWLAAAAFGLLAIPAAHAQLAGPKAIPGDYASVAAAITDLNAQGVGAGGVTFNVAAGYTETLASATAGTITATGTAANPIVFQKAGTGANPLLSAAAGGTSTTLDAIIALIGSDYVTFDGLSLAENAVNTTATTQMEFGYALFRASATDGCQHNVIRNCVVTLNKTNPNSTGIYGANSLSTATTALAVTSATGTNSNNKVFGNVVSNAATGIQLSGSSAAGFLDADNEIGVTAGNTVGNFGSSTSNWGIGGSNQLGLKISGNTVNSTLNYTSPTASTPVAATAVTSTLRGIYTTAGTSANIDITNNTVTVASGATTSLMVGIENGIGSTAAGNTVNITGNTVTNCTYATATTGAFTGITNSATAATVNLNNNTVTNNTTPGTGTMTLLSNTGVSAPTVLSISNNALTGNSKTPNATTASVTLTGITCGTASVTMNGNTVATNSIVTSGTSTSAGTLQGLTSSASSVPVENLTNNTITNLSISGTSTATTNVVRGILTSNSANTNVMTVTGNVIGQLAIATGSGTLVGLSVAGGGGTGSAFSRNKIYDLSVSGATASVTGLLVSSGGTYRVDNNLIGDLRAPAATGLLAVSGLTVAGSTEVNTYFNTIFLNASSSGATFGTSGIYLSSTSATLDARNNLVVNKSTAAGTGGFTAALRRVSGTAGTAPTNLASTTNNNLYFAGTPSATNLIYVEGTTTATNAQQTIAAYRGFMAPRETSSVTEDVAFLSTAGTSPTFLHINPAVATQVEGGGQPISGISTDVDGDARNATTPDIGADEGTFIPLDTSGPVISFTALGNTSSTANRTLTVTIADPSGVATGTNAPRLYFRKGTSGAFVFVNATTVSGSTFDFTFNNALIGGVTGGDVVQYYVAAQDALGNLNTSPVGGSGTNPPGTTNPSTIFQYRVLSQLAGTYYVGTGTSPDPARTYATLTAAAAAYANSGMSGAVTFLLLDNAYSAATGETFPVIFFNNVDASATNTLLIKPTTGATPVITAAGSVLALAGTRYVTIDGSNTTGGTSRDLTLSNTVLTASSYGLGLLTQTGLAQSNLFATVRNVNVTGGGVTTNATFGIVLSGADNDNVTLQNNSVQGVTTGIQAFGSANASAGGLDDLLIVGNVVGPATATTGANINQSGIVVANAISPVIRGNEVQNIVNPTATFASNMTGILLQDVKTGIVSRNSVHNINYTGTSTAKVYGISSQLSTSGFNTAANPTAARFDNNVVYNLNSTATSSAWNTSGINNNGGFGDQYYFNTVYLTGQLSAGSAGSAAFSNGNGITSTAAANIDVRNNIFSIIGGTGAATTPLYAHYTTAASYTGSTLNHNNLFVTVGATGLARIGRINSADAVDLAAWRTATGQEANSVSVLPSFSQVSTVPFDLTPTASALNNSGDATTGVTVDFTGATRSSTPDIGAYEFTPATIDVAATALVGPATAGCFGASEAIIVRFTNNSPTALNLAANPVTVTVVATPPSGTTQTFTATVSTGTLAGNAAQNLTLPGTFDMSAAGTYSFAVTTTTPNDGTLGNDQLTATRTVTAVATQPQLVTFTGFTGANLNTVFPGWTEATGATLPTGTTSAWGTSSFPAGNTTTKVNLYQTGKNEWIVSPKFLAGSSTVLTFDAGITDFANNNPDPAGMTGTDDFMEVRISTDCGLSFARIPTFAQFNAGNQPSNGNFTNYSIDLGAYAGQQIILAFFASEGTVDDLPDYDLHLDNISVSSPLPIDLGPVALAAPTATQGCYSAAETVSVTVGNIGTQTLDFAVNPGTVTAVVTTPGGSQTLTATLTTGTLAPGATQVVSLAQALDMSALGTYSFAITATVQGDQIPTNDVLPAVTRTVAAPVAGTITPGAPLLCVSGTAALTLTGAANGTIQWQQSADNTTFTDISGANTATFTTPVLTSTTYFRAQVRCGPQATATSNVATITVNNPLVASVNTPVAICAGSTATLTATAATGTRVRFFDAASGGTALASTAAGTTTTATTAALTANQTFYAEASVINQENVGPAAYISTGQNPQTGGALYFTAAGPITIASVTVFLNAGQAAGTVTIALRTGSSTTGTVVNSQNVAFAVPAGPATGVAPYVVPLNYSVPAAGQYTLHLSSATQSGLLRDNAGANSTGYPYISPSGLVRITAPNTSGFYYYFYDWQISSECVSAVRTPIQVEVAPTPTATLPAATASTCGTSPFQLAGTVGGSATGGTYTSTGTGAFLPDATTLNATYTPSATDVAAGTVTITLTTAGPAACTAATTQVALAISPAPDAAFSYAAATYCAGSASTISPTMGTGASAGTFSSTTGLSINATTGVIDLAASTAGTYTVTNSIAASGSCAAVSATATVVVTPGTSAAFSYASGTFCQTGTNPTPTVTGTAGGAFSSTTGLTLDAATGAITLSASTVGTYTVTYTVSGACGSTATASVTVTASPVATFSYPAATTYCAGSASTISPTMGAGASAGTFSSTAGLTINAATGVITLSSSLSGTYTVTNTIAASGSCSAATATATVTITPAASSAFTYPAATFCQTGSNPTPTLTGTTGGTFTSTTGLTLDAATGAITLNSSTPGTYTVTYTVAGSCGSATTASVTVTTGQVATFSYPTTTSYCAGSASPVTPALGTGASAGTFTSTSGLSINAATGAINLATSTAGTYTVTNTVAASGGCAAATATASVTVAPRPATPTLSAAYNGANTTLTSSAATGNQFFLNGVAIAGATNQTYVVNGTAAQLGSYTVVTTNATGCASLPSAPITVTGTRNGIAGTSLRVYPNPTPTGQVTLELTGFRRATQLTVLDALGRVVSSELLPATAGTATHSLNLTGVATGVYLLRLSNSDGVETRRLVRE